MGKNIKARRQLSDLYKQGTEIRFGPNADGKPEGKIGPFEDERGRRIPPGEKDIAMFIRPADPLQRDMSMRAAQAKRATALVKAKRDENSEEHLTIMAFLADMSDETLIDYVILGDSATRRNEAEREILGLDEWKEMTAYQDAMRQYEGKTDEEVEGDEEYETLMALDDKYSEQVRVRELELSDAQRDAMRFLSRDVIERKALDRRAEMIGSQSFMVEYERQMLYYCVRDADEIEELFFESPQELAAQPDAVRELIQEALMPYISEGSEAKNSSRAVDGSISSELPASPETSDSSTPEAQSA